MKVLEILNKYSAAANSYYLNVNNPYKEAEKELDRTIEEYEGKGYPPAYLLEPPEYKYLKSKWASRVDSNHYGFSLGQPCPIVWIKIIDEFLDYVSDMCPRFKIYKIWINYGGLKCQLDNITPEIKEEINILQETLFDEKLIK